MVAAEALTPRAETPERLLRRLEWRVVRHLEGRLQGNYRTAMRGNGTDFRDIREYEPGDDVRHIDWSVTARMDALFVRDFSEDRELSAWLLLDRSPSMEFGTAGRTKETLLRELAGTTARLLTGGGNRVGAMLYDNVDVQVIPPRQGRDQVLVLLRELLRPVARPGVPTDLGRLLDAAAARIARRSLVVVMSDFISEPGWERPLRRLAQRHEVVAIRVVDRRELELPDAGVIVVQDAETGEQLVVDTSDAELRRRFREAGARRDAEIADTARRAGVDLTAISTDDDLVRAFVRLVASRRRRRH